MVVGLYRQYAQKFSTLVKEYGRVAVGVHLSVSACSITGLYYAIDNGVDVKAHLKAWGLDHEETKRPEGAVGEQSLWQRVKAAGAASGTLGFAILVNKALFPVRLPLTVAVTPVVARYIRMRPGAAPKVK